jgi:hypothetical protein
MFDVLVPIFNMQHRFGLYDASAQVLIPFAVNGSDDDLRFWLPRLVNTPRADQSVLHLTYTHPAAWTREYAAAVLGGGSGLVCFRALLAGSGSLSMQQADLGALPYRQAVVRHLGVHEAPHERPVITILNKKVGRAGWAPPRPGRPRAALAQPTAACAAATPCLPALPTSLPCLLAPDPACSWCRTPLQPSPPPPPPVPLRPLRPAGSAHGGEPA